MVRKRFRKKSARIGLPYLLKIVVGTTLLMMVNGYLVGKIVQANMTHIPALLHDARLYQFHQIFFGFILVTIQFWVVDRLKDRHLSRVGA